LAQKLCRWYFEIDECEKGLALFKQLLHQQLFNVPQEFILARLKNKWYYKIPYRHYTYRYRILVECALDEELVTVTGSSAMNSYGNYSTYYYSGNNNSSDPQPMCKSVLVNNYFNYIVMAAINASDLQFATRVFDDLNNRLALEMKQEQNHQQQGNEHSLNEQQQQQQQQHNRVDYYAKLLSTSTSTSSTNSTTTVSHYNVLWYLLTRMKYCYASKHYNEALTARPYSSESQLLSATQSGVLSTSTVIEINKLKYMSRFNQLWRFGSSNNMNISNSSSVYLFSTQSNTNSSMKYMSNEVLNKKYKLLHQQQYQNHKNSKQQIPVLLFEPFNPLMTSTLILRDEKYYNLLRVQSSYNYNYSDINNSSNSKQGNENSGMNDEEEEALLFSLFMKQVYKYSYREWEQKKKTSNEQEQDKANGENDDDDARRSDNSDSSSDSDNEQVQQQSRAKKNLRILRKKTSNNNQYSKRYRYHVKKCKQELKLLAQAVVFSNAKLAYQYVEQCFTSVLSKHHYFRLFVTELVVDVQNLQFMRTSMIHMLKNNTTLCDVTLQFKNQ